MKLEDKGVLVTGGASGLGAACVRLLSQAGAKVVIADLNSDAGIALATEHSHTGESTFFVKTNVTEEESMRAAVRTAVETFGGLHILINCAGIGIAERVLGKSGPASLESFTRVIQVNLIGTFNAIRLAAAEMAENAPNEEGERGVIINTASVAAFDGQIGQAAGGPFQYTGKDLHEAHKHLQITSEEFDEVGAEIARALDHFHVPEREKQEVLAAIVANKPEVVNG